MTQAQERVRTEPPAPPAPGHGPLAERHEFVQAVLETVDVGIVACDADGRLLLFNGTARDFHGLEADGSVPADRLPLHFSLYEADGTTVLPPARVPLLRALREGEVSGVEIVLAPPDRARRTVLCHGRALHDELGVVVGAVLVMTDVTAARSAERQLREAHDALARSEQQYRAGFDSGPVPLAVVDAAGRVVRCNPALGRLLGTPASVRPRPAGDLVVPEDVPLLAGVVEDAARAVEPAVPVEVRVVRADGTPLWCEVVASRISEVHRGATVLVQFADVDDRKRREARLQQLAASDELTGLANRGALLEVLTERLAAGDAPHVLFVDLDGFKAVNDAHGHAAGDVVLVDVADRLRRAVRPQDLVARLGGDEFVVVCSALDDGPALTGGTGLDDGAARADAPALGGGTALSALVERLQRAVAAPVQLPAGSCRVSGTVGVARAVPGEQPAAVLARADAAMYAAKPSARSSSPGRSQVSAAEAHLVDLVATAVEEDRLRVLYQPVSRLEDGVTVGAEALLRMLDRDGTVIGPDVFIPVAEQTGAIQAMSRVVLEQACRSGAAWKRALPAGSDFVMGVNLSPRQLDDPGLLDVVRGVLAESGLAASALAMELTENLLLPDEPRVLAQLAGLRAEGVHLAADDFGTGYCSLRYLADLPFDILKIDKSWTKVLDSPCRLGRLARGVTLMARASGLVTVVEGIETEQQRSAALAHGLTLAQGYLFSRPVPPEDFVRLLTRPAVAVG